MEQRHCVAQGESDQAFPTIVFEVLSSVIALTDRRVKPVDDRAIAPIEVYVIVDQEKPEVTALRRLASWVEEVVAGAGAVLAPPEIGIDLPLAELYR